MIYGKLFKDYKTLLKSADMSFQKIQDEHSSCVKCEIHCDDCCHAIFGLFLVEAIYLKHHFDQLDQGLREGILQRADKAEEDLARIESKLQMLDAKPNVKSKMLGQERVRCPLLSDEKECLLHPYRPVTCRAYGVPTIINGGARVCWKAEFDKDKNYPAFNLDTAYKKLYRLSCRILEEAGQPDEELAAYLISIPKIVKTPIEQLMEGDLG